MSYFDDSSFLTSSYQFRRWSPSLTRPLRSASAKKSDDTLKSTFHNRNQFQSPSKQHLTEHDIHMSMESRTRSPLTLYQPAPTPDLRSIDDQLSSVSSIIPSSRLTPVRLKSATLTIPIKTTSEDPIQNTLAKQSHERRKIVHERKLRKQQTQKYTHLDTDAWMQLRQSSAPLRRLTREEEEVPVNPSTSHFNSEKYSFEALKQAINQQQNEKKFSTLQLESGTSTPMDFRPPSNTRLRTNIPNSANSSSHSRIIKRPTEVYTQPVFEPFIVAAKPLHPLFLTDNTHPSKTKFKLTKSSISASVRVRSSPSSISVPPPVEQSVQLLTSNPSTNDDDATITLTSPTDVQNIKEEQAIVTNPLPSPPVTSIQSNRPKTASNTSVKSTIKLQAKISRCRSANDAKSSLSLNQICPHFILITDDEHRIESWYHRYPFLIGTDFLQAFQSKPNKSTVSAYFIDDSHSSLHSSKLTKGYLQDKPFHIHNDWKKYDLILISEKVYFDVIIYLQTIINLIIKSSRKTIHIYQINHQEDLKAQVTFRCQQLNRQIESHV